MKDFIFAAVLALSAAMVSVGVGIYALGGGLAVGGVLLAGLAWLVLGEAGDE